MIEQMFVVGFFVFAFCNGFKIVFFCNWIHMAIVVDIGDICQQRCAVYFLEL
jgi:hypothetical protein